MALDDRLASPRRLDALARSAEAVVARYADEPKAEEPAEAVQTALWEEMSDE